ncbi:TRAP transporter large permease [Roseovarius azorensis]|nr:TRAP transporter large permease subunit [Roseovarius azorensis]
MELYFLFLLFALVALALLSGYPVAFALPGSAILTIGVAALAGWSLAGDAATFFAEGEPMQWLSAGITNFRGIYWEAERDTLIAIPLFIFMGVVLQRSKIAEDLLIRMAQLFGSVPGGLGISVVFVGALLAATTGIVGATVVAMGLISLPAMLKHGYSKPLATGTIAASGTLGQIIPPSIVLIILSDQLASAVDQASTARKALYKAATGELSMPSEFDVTSTSAGEIFLGALVPGLVLVAMYMGFILIYALLRPAKAPPVPFEGKRDHRFVGAVLLVLVPPLALVFIVLGSIIVGVATVTQAGAIGAAGTLIMAGYRLRPGRRDTFYPLFLALASLAAIFIAKAVFSTNIREISTAGMAGVVIAGFGSVGFAVALTWSTWRVYRTDDTLKGAMIETAKTTALVFVILMGAAMLTAAFRAFGGEGYVRGFLESMPGGFWSKFVIVMAIIFLLGFFLEFIEIVVVVVPIVAPILLADPSSNITAVWLGVMIGLNIQTSFLTPPFGFALFYLRGVAPPSVRTLQIYAGVVPFIVLQLVALAIMAWNPPLVNHLPNRIALSGTTAPPPINPRLQPCLEEYVRDRFNRHGADIIAAITAARNLDLAAFPDPLRQSLQGSFTEAERSLGLIAEVARANAQITDQAPAYRPLHDRVRQIESDIRQHEAAIDQLELRIRRARGKEHDLVSDWKQDIGVLKAEVAVLLARIPDSWKEVESTFQKLTQAAQTARLQYRRAADSAYAPAAEAIAMLHAIDALQALRADLPATASDLTADRLAGLSARARDIPGGRDIASALQDTRRAQSDGKDISGPMAEARALIDAEITWRTRAAETAGPGLRVFEAAIRDTIGARSQPKLSEDQARFIAGCMSSHRDLSLNF